MTLRAWLKAQPYGAQTRMSKDTGFSRVHINTVAHGKFPGSPFFWRVVADYTKGEVA